MFDVELTMEKLRRQIKNDGIEPDGFNNKYLAKVMNMVRSEECVVVFGTGAYGKIVVDYLRKSDISNIACFCDNNADRGNSEMMGLAVLKPEHACCKYPDACYIVTPKGYDNEILRQLVGLGVSVENIVLFNVVFAGMVDY
jgi:FlaA1/EpsC-like NDP-sugar epimerase